MELTTLFSGIRTCQSLLSAILGKRGTRIQKKIEAVFLLQRAINHTRTFLNQNNQNYRPDENLSDLWLNSFTAMISVDKELAKQLRLKSKFWSNPQDWLNDERLMEIIPNLSELENNCEELLKELEKRL